MQNNFAARPSPYAPVIATTTNETKMTPMLVLSQDESKAFMGTVQSNC